MFYVRHIGMREPSVSMRPVIPLPHRKTVESHNPPEPLKYLGYSTDGNDTPTLTAAALQAIPPHPFFQEPTFINLQRDTWVRTRRARVKAD